MSQANLKIVESTLAGMAEKEKEKEKWKRKEKSTDKEIEVEKEKGMKSGDNLKGESNLSPHRRESIGLCRCRCCCCCHLCPSSSTPSISQLPSPAHTIAPSLTHS